MIKGNTERNPNAILISTGGSSEHYISALPDSQTYILLTEIKVITDVFVIVIR